MKEEALLTREKEIAELESELGKARRKPLSKYDKKGKKRKELEHYKSLIDIKKREIKRIDANDYNLIVPIFDDKFSVGKIGRLGEIVFDLPNGVQTHNQYFKIISIADDNNALVEFSVSAYLQDISSMHGKQIISDTLKDVPRIYDVVPVTINVWLRGISTSNLVSDSVLHPTGFFIITGTHDYETVLGNKQTVFIFESLQVP
jgi:hypothetical protein